MEPHNTYIHAHGPKSVSIQTVTRCNCACSICPHQNIYPGSPDIIEETLWEKIIDDASRIDSATYICLTLHNEPFADPYIFRRIHQVQTLLKGQHDKWSTIITNGKALLDKHIRKKLSQVPPGVLYISLVSGNEHEYQHITGLPFITMVNTIKLVANMVDNVTVLIARTKHTNPDYIRNLIHTGPGCDTINIQFNPLVTNGGLTPQCETMRIWPFEHHLGVVCPHPFQFFSIHVDGTCVLCCFDWLRQGILGNIKDQSIMDIYYGEPLVHIREEMKQGIYRYPMCSICSKEFRFIQEDV